MSLDSAQINLRISLANFTPKVNESKPDAVFPDHTPNFDSLSVQVGDKTSLMPLFLWFPGKLEDEVSWKIPLVYLPQLSLSTNLMHEKTGRGMRQNPEHIRELHSLPGSHVLNCALAQLCSFPSIVPKLPESSKLEEIHVEIKPSIFPEKCALQFGILPKISSRGSVKVDEAALRFFNPYSQLSETQKPIVTFIKVSGMVPGAHSFPHLLKAASEGLSTTPPSVSSFSMDEDEQTAAEALASLSTL